MCKLPILIIFLFGKVYIEKNIFFRDCAYLLKYVQSFKIFGKVNG